MYVTRASVFHEDEFRLPTPYKCWETRGYKNMYSFIFLQTNCVRQRLQTVIMLTPHFSTSTCLTTLGLMVIRHWSDTSVSDQCLIDVHPTAFVPISQQRRTEFHEIFRTWRKKQLTRLFDAWLDCFMLLRLGAVEVCALEVLLVTYDSIPGGPPVFISSDDNARAIGDADSFSLALGGLSRQTSRRGECSARNVSHQSR